MTKNHLGLIVGFFVAGLHAIWSILVAIIPGPLQSFINWDLGLHHISMSFQIMPFVFWNAVILVILTFVIGYILGWVLKFLTEKIVKQ